MKWKAILMIALAVALYGRHSEIDNHLVFLGYRIPAESIFPRPDSEFCRRNLDVCSAIDFVVIKLHRLSLEAVKLTTPPERSKAPD